MANYYDSEYTSKDDLIVSRPRPLDLNYIEVRKQGGSLVRALRSGAGDLTGMAAVVEFLEYESGEDWQRPQEGDVWLFKGTHANIPSPFSYSQGGWVNMSGRKLTNPAPYGSARDETFEPRRIFRVGDK